MTQDITATTNQPDSTKKQRKKLAKREAKLMLSIENTKQKLQRGEQRLGRIQAKLEQRAGRLHDLEKKLEDIRAQSAPPADQGSVESDQPASHNGSSPIGQQGGTDEGHDEATAPQATQADITAGSDQPASPPPAEGR